MGQAIIAAAPEAEVEITAALDQGDSADSGAADFDVAVDFSLHAATAPLVASAAAKGKPVVIGTTGHTAEEREDILGYTSKIPIVWAGNYSVGVNLLFFLTRLVAERLDETFEPELVEMHHHSKQDAPSGTAERLIEMILEGRGWERDAVRHGREGLTGARPERELGVHALRGGSVVGEHSVLFAGPGERLELRHSAEDRKIFALGALRAARWCQGKRPGLYRMEDVLGLVSRDPS